MELSAEYRCTRGLVRLSPCGGWAACAEGRRVRVRDADTMGAVVSHATELAGGVVTLSFGCVAGRVAVAAACAEGRVAVIDCESGECVLDVYAGAVGVVRVALSASGALVVVSGGGVGALLVDASTACATGFVRGVSSHLAVRWLPGGRFAVLGDAKSGWLVADVLGGSVVARTPGSAEAVGGAEARTRARRKGAPGTVSHLPPPVGGLVLGEHGVVTWGSALHTAPPRLYTLDGRVVLTAPRVGCEVPDTGACKLGVRSSGYDGEHGVLALGGYDGVLRVIHLGRFCVVSAVVPGEPSGSEAKDVAVYREQARVGTAASRMLHTLGAVDVTRGDGAGGVTHVAVRAGWVAAVDERTRNVVCIYELNGATMRLALRGALVLRGAVTAIAWVGDGAQALALVAVSGGSQAYVWRKQGAAAVAVARSGTPHALTRIVGGANSTSRLVLVDTGAGRGVTFYVDE